MEKFYSLLLKPLEGLYEKFENFAPNLLAMLVILLIGLLTARLSRLVLSKFLNAVHFDGWSDRMGFTKLMRKGDLWSKPTSILSNLVFWLLVTMTLLLALNALQIHTMDQLVMAVLSYIPQLLSAVLILAIGYVFAGFISRTVLIAAANSGLHYAKLLSKAAHTLLLVLIVAMVMEQLQIAPTVVLAAFSIVFGGIVIALAIAFGVGGINAARTVIEDELRAKPDQEQNDQIDPL